MLPLKLSRLVLIIFLINRAFGNYDQTVSIKFSPRPGQLLAFSKPFNLKVAPSDVSRGYGFCLRANLWTWNTNILVESDLLTLRLDPYPLYQGRYFHEGWQFTFYHDTSLPYTRTAWNSFCATYNATNDTLSVMVNDQLVLDYSGPDIKLTKTEWNNLTLSLGGGYFTGQISDIIFWSRPLTNEELLAYWEGCDESFLANSGPEKITWPVFDATYVVDNYTQLSKILRNGFCVRNKRWDQGDRIFVFRAFPAIYEGSKLCAQINGEVVYPKDEDDLEDILEAANATSLIKKCYNRFWIPAARSGAQKQAFCCTR